MSSLWARCFKPLKSAVTHRARLVLEPLEDRVTPSANLLTNLPDYAPGSTAIFSGSGFQADPEETRLLLAANSCFRDHSCNLSTLSRQVEGWLEPGRELRAAKAGSHHRAGPARQVPRQGSRLGRMLRLRPQG